MMVSYLATGAVLGVTAGLSPGPLMTLVIGQTLRYGVREGVKVAMVPLVTDFPLIVSAALLMAKLPDYRTPLGIISVSGGLFVLYLSYGSLHAPAVQVGEGVAKANSFRKGVLVNALNPHFYLFWLTVGTPLVLKGWQEGPLSAVSFVGGFMFCIVATKMTLAVLAGSGRQFLGGRGYRYILWLLAAVLAIFALGLIRQGLELLGLPFPGA